MRVYKYSEITGKIIGCAMRVHSALGSGFQEVVYQRALAIEMEMEGLSFGREVESPIYYRDRKVGSRRMDFFVDEKVMVELKAVTVINDIHIAQTINYLEAFRIEIGLLLNFGEKSLHFRRFTNEGNT